MNGPTDPRIYQQFERTALWAAIAGALAELEATREVVVGTAPHYVIGYLCQELVAKQVVDAEALVPRA
jgi:hypothetical protein